MKARKMVAAAAVAGCAVLGSTGTAGALTAPDANDTVDGITAQVGGLLGGVLNSVGIGVPSTPEVSVPAVQVPATPQPDVRYSLSGISVTLGSTHARTGLPAVPEVNMPATPTVDMPTVPDPTGHVALVKLSITNGVETARGMAEAFEADGKQAFEAYSEQVTSSISAGLELAGLSVLEVTLAETARVAWMQFEDTRDFIIRTTTITL